MKKIIENLITFFLFVMFVSIILLILALPTMWLWNWLMPHLFGLVTINFWQALGLNFLSFLLFRNISQTK